MSSLKTILVCQNTSCRKKGAGLVLESLRKHLMVGVAIAPSSCLGMCGNGSNVLVLTEKAWYYRVQSEDAETIVGETGKDEEVMF